MSFSISSSIKFPEIDWGTLANRPAIDLSIDRSIKFCTPENWSEKSPCCMNGYAIEHALDIAHDKGVRETPAARFLEQYPCLNGVELDSIIGRFSQERTVPESGEGRKPVARSIGGVLDWLSKRLFG